MTAAIARYSRFQFRTGAGRNFIALLVAFAFALQSFLTQTHIHGSALAVGGPAIGNFSANDPVPGKAPADNSPLDCPYCQAVAHSGAFFAPAAPLLGLPAIQAERTILSLIVRAIKSAATISWRSRAPPPQ